MTRSLQKEEESKTYIDSEDILHIEAQGKIIEQTAHRMREEVEKIVQTKHPARMLVDLTGVGIIVAIPARGELVKMMMAVQPKKIAVYGASRALQVLMTFMTSAAGQKETLKTFETQVEALAWLRETGE